MIFSLYLANIKTLMVMPIRKETDLEKKLHQKDEIIHQQEKRIRLLEDRFADLRNKYFHLKYDGKITLLHTK